MYRILTLNNISKRGLDRFPRETYEVDAECANPDAILVRSANLHQRHIPESVLAIARAGAGVNNIPLDAMTERAIVVFNAPGANANAVKELVIAGMLLAARNLCQAWEYVLRLETSGEALEAQVEAGKKQYVGHELPGRTLGVIGLGAIGVQVANAARALGMRVIGFDAALTVGRAWQLASDVIQAYSVDEVMRRSDFLTVHVPLTPATRGLIDGSRLAIMPRGGVLLNFARAGIVDDRAAIDSLDSGHLAAYVNDFPTDLTRRHPRCITLPHLGASTTEAEENCAVMVADQLRGYLEHGNIRNAVNFPDVVMPRSDKGERLAVVNANVPNMLGQISTTLASHGLNIDDMYNKAHGDLAYTLVDVEGALPEALGDAVRAIPGVLSVRMIR
jgi:D-3-phosphoglycerate dehydrogenase / 2-oxoglutarate reductase